MVSLREIIGIDDLSTFKLQTTIVMVNITAVYEFFNIFCLINKLLLPVTELE